MTRRYTKSARWFQARADPAFRARNAAAVRKNWKDPAFRARNADATRKVQSARLREQARQIEAALERFTGRVVAKKKALQSHLV